VIEPPEERVSGTYEAGDELRFRVIFVGNSAPLFPYFVAATDRMSKWGLGSSRGRFRLVEVRESPAIPLGPVQKATQSARTLWSGPDSKIESPLIRSVEEHAGSAAAEQAEFEFLTPLRLVTNGQLCSELTFRHLSRALLARLSSLLYFHCNANLRLDFRAALNAASEIQVIEKSLQLKPLTRWSNRQKTNLRLDGLIGRIVFAGRHLPSFYRLLEFGSIFHVGKGTVFGLGRYRIINHGKEKNG
jgi:CRISPR-associated endoribonuclease Cas6